MNPEEEERLYQQEVPEGMGDGELLLEEERLARLHYHGDIVRVLFVLMAILLLLGDTTGAAMPFPPGGSVVLAVVVAILAGITNPEQHWIHWINEIIVAGGVLTFGKAAVVHFRAGAQLLDPSYFYSEGIAILSLAALYFTTKTIRGIVLRHSSR